MILSWPASEHTPNVSIATEQPRFLFFGYFRPSARPRGRVLGAYRCPDGKFPTFRIPHRAPRLPSTTIVTAAPPASYRQFRIRFFDKYWFPLHASYAFNTSLNVNLRQPLPVQSKGMLAIARMALLTAAPVRCGRFSQGWQLHVAIRECKNKEATFSTTSPMSAVQGQGWKIAIHCQPERERPTHHRRTLPAGIPRD
jgi:hypothetical protein